MLAASTGGNRLTLGEVTGRTIVVAEEPVGAVVVRLASDRTIVATRTAYSVVAHRQVEGARITGEAVDQDQVLGAGRGAPTHLGGEVGTTSGVVSTGHALQATPGVTADLALINRSISAELIPGRVAAERVLTADEVFALGVVTAKAAVGLAAVAAAGAALVALPAEDADLGVIGRLVAGGRLDTRRFRVQSVRPVPSLTMMQSNDSGSSPSRNMLVPRLSYTPPSVR